MQRDGTHVMLIEMLIDLEGARFMVHRRTQCLVQWRKAAARNVDDRSVDLGDRSDQTIVNLRSVRVRW
jgi:hypothetical protein